MVKFGNDRAPRRIFKWNFYSGVKVTAKEESLNYSLEPISKIYHFEIEFTALIKGSSKSNGSGRLFIRASGESIGCVSRVMMSHLTTLN